jgi:Aminotransferase class-V
LAEHLWQQYAIPASISFACTCFLVVADKCVLDSCRYLQQRGFDVTYLPVGKDGLLNLEELEAAFRPDTALVSIMAVNNEIGGYFRPRYVVPALVSKLAPTMGAWHAIVWKGIVAQYGKLSAFPSSILCCQTLLWHFGHQMVGDF